MLCKLTTDLARPKPMSLPINDTLFSTMFWSKNLIGEGYGVWNSGESNNWYAKTQDRIDQIRNR